MPEAPLVRVGELSEALRTRHGVALKNQGRPGTRRPVAPGAGRCSALEQVKLDIVHDRAASSGGTIAERIRTIERAIRWSDETGGSGRVARRARGMVCMTPVHRTPGAVRYTGCPKACWRRVRERPDDSKAIIVSARDPGAVTCQILRNRRILEDLATSGYQRTRSRRPDAMGDKP